MSYPFVQPPFVPQPYRHGARMLAVFISIYLLSFWFYAVGSVGDAAIFYLAGTAFVFGSYAMFLIDWHGLTSLNGRITWARLSRGRKFWWAFALLLLVEFILAIYFFFAAKDHLAATHQTVGQVFQTAWQRYLTAFRRSRLTIASITAATLIVFVGMSSLGLAGGNPPNLNGATATTTSGQLVVNSNQTRAQPTKAPSATATPKPTPKPTPRPTPRPTTPPPPATLSITFTCASAVDYSYGQVCIHTEPGAALEITVTYCTGYPATSESLKGTEYANGSGNFTWSWTQTQNVMGKQRPA